MRCPLIEARGRVAASSSVAPPRWARQVRPVHSPRLWFIVEHNGAADDCGADRSRRFGRHVGGRHESASGRDDRRGGRGGGDDGCGKRRSAEYGGE